MGLAPSPHPLGALAIAEVGKVLGFTIPSLLTGELTGPATLGFAAVMLTLPVPVIREEKRAAIPALTSLGFWAHREPKPTQPPPESKQNNGAEEKPKGRSKKSFQEKSRKKRPGKKNGISNRWFSRNIIPPLRVASGWPRGGYRLATREPEGSFRVASVVREDSSFIIQPSAFPG
jgi:hypothetical protein